MNRYDYSSITPSFLNVVRPKRNLANRLVSSGSLSSINGIIDSAQKAINIYNKALPIINQVRPMIGNIKTTFKVARAFKRFSNESSIEKAFDNLPDYNDGVIQKEKRKLSNPFYP